MRMVTVLRPGTPPTGWCFRCKSRNCVQGHPTFQVTAIDYVLVDRELTIGSAFMVDLIPAEQLAALRVFTNGLERSQAAQKGKRYAAPNQRRQSAVEPV